MFGPDYKAGCPSCSMIADGFDGFAVHLAHHDVMLMAVSRAPLAKLKAYKERMGWKFPWASSHGGDFNFDFHVSYTEAQETAGPVEYNYARGAPPWTSPHAAAGQRVRGELRHGRGDLRRDRPGMSAFVLEDGVVYQLIRPTREDSTACGAPTNGSIARRRAQ